MAFNELEVQREVETENSFLDDLLAFVEEHEVEELELTGLQEEGFRIQSTDQANYIARKVKELRAEQEEAQKTAKMQIEAYKERVETWLEQVMKPLQNQEEFFLRLLEDFAREKLSGSNKKSLKLIEGTLQFRKQQDKFEYDDDLLLNYVESNLPEYIKTKLSVDKVNLKKAGKVKNGRLYINDEPVAGIAIMPQDDKFDVK